MNLSDWGGRGCALGREEKSMLVWARRRRPAKAAGPLGGLRSLSAAGTAVVAALAGFSALVGLAVAGLPAVAAPAFAVPLSGTAALAALASGASAPIFPTLVSSVDQLTDGPVLLGSLACPTSSFCVAVGVDEYPGPGVLGAGVVLAIDNGVVGEVVHVPGTSALTTVACWTPSACVAVGYLSGYSSATSATVVVPITGGIPGAVQDLPAATNLSGLTCPEATMCLAVGFIAPASSLPTDEKAVVVPISGGVAGTAQTVP